jgi:hypothetical protein
MVLCGSNYRPSSTYSVCQSFSTVIRLSIALPRVPSCETLIGQLPGTTPLTSDIRLVCLGISRGNQVVTVRAVWTCCLRNAVSGRLPSPGHP